MLLGIDIGGTSIKFAVIDDNYKIVHYETCKTPDNVTVKITEKCSESQAKSVKAITSAAGISAAGVIDNVNMEVIRSAPTIKNYLELIKRF